MCGPCSTQHPDDQPSLAVRALGVDAIADAGSVHFVSFGPNAKVREVRDEASVAALLEGVAEHARVAHDHDVTWTDLFVADRDEAIVRHPEGDTVKRVATSPGSVVPWSTGIPAVVKTSSGPAYELSGPPPFEPS